MDTPNAWRFGKGSEKTILVSLDAGLELPLDKEIDHVIQKTEHVVKEQNAGHQDKAISVMGGKTVGIAPKSILCTYNVYPGSNLTLTNLIKAAIQEANEKNLVFQTSIQGEIWWWSAKEGTGDPIKSKEYTKKNTRRNYRYWKYILRNRSG